MLSPFLKDSAIIFIHALPYAIMQVQQTPSALPFAMFFRLTSAAHQLAIDIFIFFLSFFFFFIFISSIFIFRLMFSFFFFDISFLRFRHFFAAFFDISFRHRLSPAAPTRHGAAPR